MEEPLDVVYCSEAGSVLEIRADPAEELAPSAICGLLCLRLITCVLGDKTLGSSSGAIEPKNPTDSMMKFVLLSLSFPLNAGCAIQSVCAPLVLEQ